MILEEEEKGGKKQRNWKNELGFLLRRSSSQIAILLVTGQTQPKLPAKKSVETESTLMIAKGEPGHGE